MTEKNEALRLAAELEACPSINYKLHAAELRRLQIDNDALGVHLSERMKDLFKAEAQRDALLEALKEIVDAADGDGWDQLDPSFKKARAAIAKVEGNT